MFGERDFLHLLTREVSRCNRYRDYFALCLLAPSTPDVAGQVLKFLRVTDLIGTIDGLIGILLINSGPDEALRIAERLRVHVSGSAPAGSSIGPTALSLACFPGDGLTSTHLVERAKARLRLAQQAGGDRVVYSEGS